MREITIYPHDGRNYACTDTITIEDQWSLLDAFNHARHRGQVVANTSPHEYNFGNVVPGPVPSRKIQVLPVGIVPSLLFFTSASWRTYFAFEINPNFNAFAVEATIRLLNESEYNTINSAMSGNGWRGQRLRLLVTNGANLAIQYLGTVYADPSWYAANVGALDPVVINYQSLEGGNVKLLSLIVGITGSILQATRANPAWVYAQLQYSRNVNGTAWGTTYTESTAFLPPAVHPIHGGTIQGAGLIDLHVTQFYLPGHTAVPSTGTVGPGRTVTRFNPAEYPEMGAVLSASEWARAAQDYAAARSIGFDAYLESGRNLGGVPLPLVGDRGIIVNELGSQQFTRYIEVPPNAKRAVVVGWVRADAAGGMTQTLTVDFFKPLAIGQTNQVLLTATSSPTSERLVYADVALQVGIQPQTANVERGWIVVKSTKTNPRAGTVGNPAQISPPDPQFMQFDGVYSLCVKFY